MNALLGAAVLIASALPAGVPVEKARRYLDCVRTCLDNLLEFGTDRYGKTHSPMLMNIIDVRTNECPVNPETLDMTVRHEGRAHRRAIRGSNLWADQPTLTALYAFGEVTGSAKYGRAADDYVKYTFDHCRLGNGLLAWGSHNFWDCFAEKVGGDDPPTHETCVNQPVYDHMWRVAPDELRAYADLVWEYHVCDKETGETNRHDNGRCELDFCFCQSAYMYVQAFVYGQTRDEVYLERAKKMASHHWNARSGTTGLPPSAPGAARSDPPRYDGLHTFTDLPGPHCRHLLMCHEATGEKMFKEYAVSYLRAFNRHAWDEAAGRFHGMISLNGVPVPEQPAGSGYDVFKPAGHSITWRVLMLPYEYPLIAARTYVEAYEIEKDPELLEGANRWARQIRADMPPQANRRWKDQLYAAMPRARRTGGTYAENYGNAISFFVALHRVTNDPAHLDTAITLADEAVDKLYTRTGWFKGHPAKPYYEATDGVGVLLCALLELAEYPNPLPGD